MTFQDVVPYLPCLTYLALVSALLVSRLRVPVAVHVVALVAGVAAQAVLTQAVVAVLAGVGAGLFALLFCVYLARGVLSAVAVYTISVALAIVPMAGWLGLMAGVLVAAVVGAVRTATVGGVARVQQVAASTALAMGVTPGGFVPPNPGMLPQAEDASQIVRSERDAKRMRLVLAPYLFMGVLAAAAVALLR